MDSVVYDLDLDLGSHAALTISLRALVHADESDDLSRLLAPGILRRLSGGVNAQKRCTLSLSLDEKTVAFNALDLAVRHLNGDPSCYDPIFHLTSLPSDMAAYAQAIRAAHAYFSALEIMKL